MPLGNQRPRTCSIKISSLKELTLKGVSQYFVITEEHHKLNCLDGLFSNLQITQGIIFCLAAHVDLLATKIRERGFSATKIERHFRNGSHQFLVSSEALAKIRSANVLVNFDLPKDIKSYVDRIGSSGESSLCINLTSRATFAQLKLLEKELGTVIPPLPGAIDPSTYKGDQVRISCAGHPCSWNHVATDISAQRA